MMFPGAYFSFPESQMNSQDDMMEGRTKFIIYSLFAYPILPPHPFLSLFQLQREEGGPNAFLFCACTYELALSFSTSHITTPFSYFPGFPHFFLNTMQRYFCQQNNYPCFQIPKQQLHHHTSLLLLPLKGSTLNFNFLLQSIKHFLLLAQNKSVRKAKPK